MRVLVTGASGFLGQHLVTALALRNHVVALIHDRDVGTDAEEAVHGDVCDLGFLRRILARHSITHIVHLAAQTQVGIGELNPIATYDTNIRGTWTVLEACRLEGMQRCVVASSDKVYGECEDATELSSLSPSCPYSMSKIAADMLAQTYDFATVTRCGNLYGTGDINLRRLVPGAMHAFATDCKFALRTDGEEVRHYLHVDDAVEAYMKLLATEHTGAFNFAGPEPCTADRMLSLLEKHSKQRLQITRGSAAELRVQTLDCSKAKRLLGWKPKVTLEQGVGDLFA